MKNEVVSVLQAAINLLSATDLAPGVVADVVAALRNPQLRDKGGRLVPRLHIPCPDVGLNADWNGHAYMLSDGTPNRTDDAIYLVDGDDNELVLVRRHLEGEDETLAEGSYDFVWDDEDLKGVTVKADDIIRYLTSH